MKAELFFTGIVDHDHRSGVHSWVLFDSNSGNKLAEGSGRCIYCNNEKIEYHALIQGTLKMNFLN